MRQFNIPPVLPLVGSTFSNYLKIIANGRIEPRYFPKVILTGFVILVATPFHILDFIWYRKKLQHYSFRKEPIFILGHWRSGTTLLHNCLCQDKSAGYLTTYQSLFPNNLKSKFLFWSFVKIGMPEKRPSDNMEFKVYYPQEGGFALGNLHPDFYYKFFFFPTKYSKYYEKAVRMHMQKDRKSAWKKAYMNLLKKAAINTNGDRIIVKNPVNTARIQTILEVFPNAKFLFVYRNPIKVYLSTQRFFYNLMPTIWLHRVDQKYINQMILETYINIMDDYQDQKHLIPDGNLTELRFEDFEEDPLKALHLIYKGLLNEDFERVRDTFSQYLETLKNYRKNRYSADKNTIDTVNKHWEKYMRMWNYHVPSDVSVS